MQNMGLWGHVSHRLQKQHATVFSVVKSCKMWVLGGVAYVYKYMYIYIYVCVCVCVFVCVESEPSALSLSTLSQRSHRSRDGPF